MKGLRNAHGKTFGMMMKRNENQVDDKIKDDENIYELGREYSRAFVLCSGMDKRHCLPAIREGKQIRSVSCDAIFSDVSIFVNHNMDNRGNNLNVGVDTDVDTLACADVQSVPRRDVQVANCRRLC